MDIRVSHASPPVDDEISLQFKPHNDDHNYQAITLVCGVGGGYSDLEISVYLTRDDASTLRDELDKVLKQEPETTVPSTHCGRCHTCGTPLAPCLDGEQWCPVCNAYRRYVSHGWAKGATGVEDSPCLSDIHDELKGPDIYAAYDELYDRVEGD